MTKVQLGQDNVVDFDTQYVFPNGQVCTIYYLSGNHPAIVSLWDLNTGSYVGTSVSLSGGANTSKAGMMVDEVNDVVYFYHVLYPATPATMYVYRVVGAYSDPSKLLNTANYERIGTFTSHGNYPIPALRIDPNGNPIFGYGDTSNNHYINVYDGSNWTEYTISGKSRGFGMSHFRSDGTAIVVWIDSNTNTAKFYVWDFNTKSQVGSDVDLGVKRYFNYPQKIGDVIYWATNTLGGGVYVFQPDNSYTVQPEINNCNTTTITLYDDGNGVDIVRLDFNYTGSGGQTAYLTYKGQTVQLDDTVFYASIANSPLDNYPDKVVYQDVDLSLYYDYLVYQDNPFYVPPPPPSYAKIYEIEEELVEVSVTGKYKYGEKYNYGGVTNYGGG